MTERRTDESTDDVTSERTEDVTGERSDDVAGAPAEDVDTASDREPLLAPQEGADFRGRWETIQAGFVDEPREAVEQANALVESLMKQLADSFSERRGQLERQWDRGDEVSTEDLRIALQRYRSFFDRLLQT